MVHVILVVTSQHPGGTTQGLTFRMDGKVTPICDPDDRGLPCQPFLEKSFKPNHLRVFDVDVANLCAKKCPQEKNHATFFSAHMCISLYSHLFPRTSFIVLDSWKKKSWAVSQVEVRNAWPALHPVDLKNHNLQGPSQNSVNGAIFGCFQK